MKPLRFKNHARALAVCAPIAAAGALVLAGVSYAGNADVNCDPGQPQQGACTLKLALSYPIDDTAVIEGCPARYVGTTAIVTGTGEDRLHFVFGGAGFHFHSDHSENVRFTFSDGAYGLADINENLNYNSPDLRNPTLTLTNTFRLQGQIYSADGVPTGETVSGHGTTHFTWNDTDGNGDPTPGDDYKAYVDNFRITCR